MIPRMLCRIYGCRSKDQPGKLGGVPARKEMPAGCHDCSLGELRSTFQYIATEREIHRNGSLQRRSHKELCTI